jgi:hypothetical protein
MGGRRRRDGRALLLYPLDAPCLKVRHVICGVRRAAWVVRLRGKWNRQRDRGRLRSLCAPGVRHKRWNVRF